FQPKNSTQTSLLVLQRKSPRQIELEKAAAKQQDYNVFLALGDHVGHDKRGNATYVRDQDGNEVIETKREKVREVHEGVPVIRDVETRLERNARQSQHDEAERARLHCRSSPVSAGPHRRALGFIPRTFDAAPTRQEARVKWTGAQGRLEKIYFAGSAGTAG